MSITIISAPQAAVGGFAAEPFSGGADSVTLSADFASLLVGQLLSATAATTPVKDVPDENSPEPVDAAYLLAATGFLPMENRATTRHEQAEGEIGDVPLLSQQPAWGGGKEAMAADARVARAAQEEGQVSAKTAPIMAGAEDEPDFAIVLAGKPAKFAAGTGAAAHEIAANGTGDSKTIAPLTPAVNTTHGTGVTVSEPVVTREMIDTPVHDRNWQNAFTQKVVWLASHDKQSAQITLNPPHMGPIEISLNIDKGNATASFVSANADVRESIEAALPRLREMFAGVGLELGQANVGADSFRQTASEWMAQQTSPRGGGDKAILVGDAGMQLAAAAVFSRQGRGLVDIFA